MRAASFLKVWVLLLSTTAGCGGRGAHSGEGQDEDGRSEAPAGAPEATGKVIEISARKPVGEVHPGDVLEWSISDSSPSVDSGTAYDTPTVSGDAVAYVATVPDGDVMPGGSPVHVHRFMAKAPGTATLTATAQAFGAASAPAVVPEVGADPEPSGARERPGDLAIVVKVTAP